MWRTYSHTNSSLSATTPVPLPNILIMTGISNNVGHEGIDLERLRRRYTTLPTAAGEHIDELQIIVADNDPPPIFGVHRALELPDTDRLVPGVTGTHEAPDAETDQDGDSS